ncbi:hypothetical protein RP20_CCG000370 [Aedes albopictus]|nr:hypothetical protein RP20_CCG000370 [Aedes albopictus]
MSAKLIHGWSLPDGAFFPCSIHSIGNDAKTVLIVPGGGVGQVFTLVIKNFQHNVHADGAPPHKVFRIKLKKGEGRNCLAETVITASHTVSRTVGGELVVFGSFREGNVIDGIQGIKAIGCMEEGSKLAVIRAGGENKLKLEVLDDLVACQVNDVLQSFDLPWEKSEFEVSHDSQMYKIKSVRIAKNDSKFFKRFLNCNDIAEEKEIILFTMDNGLYWLKILEGSYEIVTVKLYPALIEDYSYAPTTGCFAVLVSNAVLHIYSISEDADCLLLQEDKRYLGPSVDTHLFIAELSTFLYSSRSHVTQIRYYYSELSKAILNVSKEIQIVGVVGMTYLDYAKMAVCITDNRLFYSVPIHKLTDANCNPQNAYFELTDEILSQANQMTCLLTNEVTIEKAIVKQINHEQVQIDILASGDNHVHEKLIEVELMYHKHLPNLRYSTLILNDKAHISNLFVQMDITLNRGIKAIVNRQRDWHLLVCLDEVITQIPFNKVNYVEDTIIRILAPIEASQVQRHGFPRIEINAMVTVTHHHDRLMLEVPLKLKSQDNVVVLFEASSHEPKTTNPESQLTNVPRDLIRHCEQKPSVRAPTLEFHLQRLAECPTLNNFLSQIGIPLDSCDNAGTATKNKGYIRLGDFLCEVEQADQGKFRFKSTSAGALYLLKVLCSKKFQHKVVNVSSEQLKVCHDYICVIYKTEKITLGIDTEMERLFTQLHTVRLAYFILLECNKNLKN